MEKFPPLVCTATETFLDLSNKALHCNQPAQPQKLYVPIESVVRSNPLLLQIVLAELTRDLHLQHWNAIPVSYVDVFLDDFFFLFQGTAHRWHHICCTLFHALYKVL